MLTDFLQKIGLDTKEAAIMLSVMQLGAQPASIVAKHVKYDRTTTYRLLKNLCSKKLLSTSKQKGTTVFYLEKASDLKHYLENEKEKFAELAKEFEEISPQLELMQSHVQKLPRIQIYDGFDQLEHFYRAVVERALEQKLLLIRILGSNTFSQQLERKELGTIMKNFEKDIASAGLKADILIAQGNLTREWLTHLDSLKSMTQLPAAGGATNLILAGESVFVVSFRDFPVGIRIDHPDIAYTLHFLFDKAQRK